MSGLIDLARAIDTHVFYWINVALAHPWLDWLLPRIADFGPVRLALGIFAAALLIWGKAGAKAAVIAIAVSVLLIDRGACRWIKYETARPRPYQQLSGIWHRTPSGMKETTLQTIAAAAREPRRSLPSSHAANTMAIACVAWAAWGRRAWLLFVLSFLVGWSRVYCGVHYPADVLIGWMLGAAIAGFVVIGTERLWSRWGKLCAPRAHASAPHLFKKNKAVT